MTAPKPLVLVVHPEDHIRVSLYSILDHEGYGVATCERASEALRYLAEARPSIVVSDSRIPDMDVWEFLQRVRSGSLGTRMILLGHSLQDVRKSRDVDSLGVMVLLRPLQRRELLRAVEGRGDRDASWTEPVRYPSVTVGADR